MVADLDAAHTWPRSPGSPGRRLQEGSTLSLCSDPSSPVHQGMENWHFTLLPCGFLPVAMAEAKKTFGLSDVYCHREKKPQQQNQAKLKLLVDHQGTLNSCTTMVVKWNWEVWYHTEMPDLTSWSCEQFRRSYCKKACYPEQESSAHGC